MAQEEKIPVEIVDYIIDTNKKENYIATYDNLAVRMIALVTMQ